MNKPAGILKYNCEGKKEAKLSKSSANNENPGFFRR
jgi:hypothetical protein